MSELFAWCRSNEVPITVASRGLDLYIVPVLDAFGLAAGDVLCGIGRVEEGRVLVSYEHLLDAAFAGERHQKRLAVLRQRAAGRAVAFIGDSRWDYPAAAIADMVLARDGLLAECRVHGVECSPFEDFIDVLEVLRKGRVEQVP